MGKQKKHLMPRGNKKNIAKNAKRIQSNIEVLKKLKETAK
jgi:hypothetical protein